MKEAGALFVDQVANWVARCRKRHESGITAEPVQKRWCAMSWTKVSRNNALLTEKRF
jgi:hypothetical protein